MLPSAAIEPAFGHAVPVKYSIAPNAQFHEKSELPQQLAISFSERPDPNVSYIRVADAQGQRIDNNDFAVIGENGRQAAVTLDTGKVRDGIYTVSWFTMSLDDGHITEGAYVFGMGHEVVPAGGPSETRYVTSYEDALAKWPLIVAQTAIVGGAMAHAILRKKLEEEGAAGRFLRRFSIILLASAGAVAASATVIMLLQAGNLAEAAGVPLGQAAQSLVASSPAGAVWLIRLAASAIVVAAGAVLACMMKKGDKKPLLLLLLYAILAAGAVSLFSNSMLSHNSAAPFLPALATALDWAHFMAVSAWVGGLFYLALVFAPATRRSPRQLATALPRFSLVATVSLGVIGVTGIYMAWVHLHALDSLFSTPYGTSLATKLAAALPMVLLGAYHQLRLHREIVVLARSGGQEYAATSRFGRTVKAEALVGIGVLLAASFLTITSPPAQAMTTHQQSGPHFMHRVNVDGVDIALEISPFQPGVNTFTATLLEGGTNPPQNIASVVLRLTNVDAGVGPLVVTLQKTGDGVYSATGGYLSQAGEWKMDFIAQRVNAYDLNHSFTETLVSGQAMPPGMPAMPEMDEEDSNTEMLPSFDSFAALALGLAAAVAGGSAFYARQSRLQMKKTLAALG
ncbi:CopD family protein [Nitrososphaera viennensis]|uniref:CopD family protein n=1 Tax=Nitrososphaera viennensis TaxID=1034015 RepID=UPI00130D59ED|nr:CopD family protein [Nitrososphaera viennensis]